ncbi:hypothetical protein [Rhizobium phage RHph_X2_24]|nr:hypothetical protein [Rhizobium phage RHph_X2_24]
MSVAVVASVNFLGLPLALGNEIMYETGNSNREGTAAMKNIIYQSVKFNENDIVAVYARGYSDGTVKFFDVNAKNKTIREYWVKREHLDAETAAKIHVSSGYFDQVRVK